MEVRAEYKQFQIYISRGPRTCSLLARAYYDVTWYAFDSMLFTSRCIGATMFIGIIRFYLRNLYHTSKSCGAAKIMLSERACTMIIIFSNTSILISIVTPFLLFIDQWSARCTISHMNLSNVCNIKSIWDFILYIYIYNIYFFNIY